MRKMLLMMIILTFCWIIIAAASDTPTLLKLGYFGEDTLVSLNRDAQVEPMILHQAPDHFSLKSIVPQPTSRPDKMLLLDPPPNDNCTSATPIGDVDSLIFSAVDATFDGPGGAIITPDIWYLYTASATGPVQIDVGILSNLNDFPVIAVYGGSSCPAYEPPPPLIPIQGGESIADATPIIGPLPVAYTGTLSGHIKNYDLLCAAHTYAPDVVYSYTATSNNPIIVSLCPSDTASWPPLLGILDADGNDLACSRNTNWPTTQILNFPVTQGETYYIVVSSLMQRLTVGYTLVVTSPSYNLLEVNTTLPSEVQRLVFDAIQGQQYLIELGSAAFGRNIYPLTDGYMSVGPAPAPPENDDCAGATDGGVLHPEEPIQFSGDNTGATSDCPVFTDIPTVWIKFTTEETMDVRIDYCGNPMNTDYIVASSALSNSCPCNPDCRIMGTMDATTPFLLCPNSSFVFDWYNLPPGTYWYPVYVIHELEGPYVVNITGSVMQNCATDAIIGQRPSSPPTMIEPINFGRSEVGTGFVTADRFSAGPTDTITQVTWWGVHQDSVYMVCEPESNPFQIIFCNNNHSTPSDTVAFYNVIASRQETGYLLNGLHQERYVASLDPPLVMVDGWILIRGNGEDQCDFLWQNSTGIGGFEYDISTYTWSNLGYNLAFCLDGISGGQGSCDYVPGDINGNGAFNGIDVTYGVGYFKGGTPPPYTCDCNGSVWYVAGDVNGNCSFNGIDITYMVSYFKGGAAPIPCQQCPPVVTAAKFQDIVPTLKPMNKNLN